MCLKLRKRLERFGKVEMIDVVSERNFLHKTWATSELRRERKHGKEDCYNYRVFVKQVSGAH
jgi:hypothetical protein